MERGAAHETTGIDQPTTERAETQTASPSPGIEFPRYFTLPGVDPFDEVTWEQRSAVIGNERGEVVFEQRDVEIPSFWSQQATNIVVSKYFRGEIGKPEREGSVKQLIAGVVNRLRMGRARRLLRVDADCRAQAALKPSCVPEGRVNSPVGQLRVRESAANARRASINPADTMESILTWRAPGQGSVRIGHGIEPVRHRSSKELLRGRQPRRVRSRHEGYDAFAGASAGGRRGARRRWSSSTRHPDSRVINCKFEEEKRRGPDRAGYDGSFTARRTRLCSSRTRTTAYA